MIEYKKDLALLIMRLIFGGFMLFAHGLPKLQKLLAGAPYKFPDVFGIGNAASLGLAVFSEVVCAALLVLGLLTRWVSIPLIITMFIAAFYVHWGDPFGKKEMALLYLFGYVVILALGPGRISLDRVLRPKF